MIIVKKDRYYDTNGKLLDNPLPNQVVDDNNYAYNYFDSLEDVIYFRPRLSNKYNSKVPYCAFRKKAFVFENLNIDNNDPPILREKNSHKAVVFVDNADKDKIQPRFIKYCEQPQYVYLKVNLLETDLQKYTKFNLHPHAITPASRSVCAWLKTKNWSSPRSLTNKNYDVCFVGAMRSKGRRPRKKTYAKLQEAVSELGLSGKFIGGNVSAGKYMNFMNDSKICPSLKGLGYRCRREWETMLANSVCLMDWKSKKNVVVMDMDVGTHFLWLKKDMASQLRWCMNNMDELSRIQMAGYNRALECFIYGRLNLEERIIRLFLINPESHIGNYSDLVLAEKNLSLSN